jgi:hypothetical protein
MKSETTHYVSECDTCRKVKADYMKPGGLLQPLSIPDWKWDDISKDSWVLDAYPSPSTRCSGELSPPPTCPAGSLSAVGAQAPSFAPPPPL